MGQVTCPHCRKTHTPVTVLGGNTAADLVKILQELEDTQTDHQYAIFRFGSHWKVACAIPELSECGRLLVRNLLSSENLVDAVTTAIETKQGGEDDPVWKMCECEITEKVYHTTVDKCSAFGCKRTK